MAFLNRQHVSAAPTLGPVQWDEPLGRFAYKKPGGGRGEPWVPVPLVSEFIMDVWTAKHGFEAWKDNTPTTVLASVSRPLPTPPEGKATALYSVPINSKDIGGWRDLIIKGKSPTEAFCDLFDEVAEHLSIDDVAAMPVISVVTETGDFGSTPKFTIENWIARPLTMAPAIVDFQS